MRCFRGFVFCSDGDVVLKVSDGFDKVEMYFVLR